MLGGNKNELPQCKVKAFPHVQCNSQKGKIKFLLTFQNLKESASSLQEWVEQLLLMEGSGAGWLCLPASWAT